MKIKKLILLFPILILFNCSLQKRKYQSGYFLSWNKNNLSIAKNQKQKGFNVQKKEIKFIYCYNFRFNGDEMPALNEELQNYLKVKIN